MRALDHNKIAQILLRGHSVATQVVRHFYRLSGDESPNVGGYLVVADSGTGLPLGSIFVGDVPDDKAARYIELAQEKAIRLSKKISTEGHVLSWESRDEAADCWGGAVLVSLSDIILSFSGFTEMWDEAVGLVTASIALNVPSSGLITYASVSKNREFFQLMNMNGVYLIHPLAFL